MSRNRVVGWVAAVGSVALLAGCGMDSAMTGAPDAQAGFGQRNGGVSQSRTYSVTIENMTGGQPFTPPLVATHQRAVDLFDTGVAASLGVREIAENGNLQPMLDRLNASDHVSYVVVAVAGTPPPVLPGANVSFTIDAEPGARHLSFISMLICTNDGFTGVDSQRLPSQVGQQVVLYTNAYDAGSEINTEDFADLVPPCPALTGVRRDPPGPPRGDGGRSLSGRPVLSTERVPDPCPATTRPQAGHPIARAPRAPSTGRPFLDRGVTRGLAPRHACPACPSMARERARVDDSRGELRDPGRHGRDRVGASPAGDSDRWADRPTVPRTRAPR